MMPHEKGPLSSAAGAGTVAVDHKKALKITPGGKLDNCQVGNPLKIHKRKGPFDKFADGDVIKSAKKDPKIHWTQLTANGASSDSTHRHNGKQTEKHNQNDSVMLDIKRQQLKVVLMDVLQTEEGQRYLSSCGCDSNEKMQSPLKRGHKEGRHERRCSAEHNPARSRASAPCKDQTSFSPHKLTNSPPSKTTDSVCAEENDPQLSKEVQSPAVKRCKRLSGLLKQAEHAAPDKEESCSLREVDSSPDKERHNLLPKHTGSLDAAQDKSRQVKKSDSPKPRSVVPFRSEEVELEQLSESLITASPTLSQVKQTSVFHRAEFQDSESDREPTRQNTSNNTAQGYEEVERRTEQASEEEEDEEKEGEEPLHLNGDVLDEGGGSRGSVLRLSTGAAEAQLADGDVTPKSSQIAVSADKHILDSELVHVRQASKPQATEPIVLSSEEEEDEKRDEEDGGTSRALEGAKDPCRIQNPVQAIERKKIPDAHIHPCDMNSQGSSFDTSALHACSVMELQFSAVYMGSLGALTNGFVKITDDRITISFKDPSGSEVKSYLATTHVRKYSVWDGSLVRDSHLAKENELPPPSVLLLWLAEGEARHLSNSLSVFQPATCPVEGSTCVVLCVSEPLNGVQGALLASIMDIVGLRNGNAELLSPLTHPDSLKFLQSSRDSHMLQLLLPRAETHTVSCESGTTSVPASTTTTSAKDSVDQPDSRVYTLCQSRGQSAYSVSLAHKPGADWVRYRHCGPARRLIQFPPPPSKGAITVTTEDLECLDSGEFLNDVIIDFYLKYLLVQKAPHASVRRSHIFSSFFYKQLTRRDNANEETTSTPTQLRRHQRVRTWTRHVDIFEKDFLFVPVNQEAHWYLVVVCFPGLGEPHYVQKGGQTLVHDETENSSDTTAQSESQHDEGDINSDENSSRSNSASGPPTCTENTCKRHTVCKRPCILIMDSLKLSVHERIFKLLREYLQAEWEVKRGGYRDFSAERMVGSHCRVPLQDNSSDCGLYLLQYAESFLQDPVVHFDLPLKLECWFPRQKVREKRDEIRDLVLHLYRFQQGSLGNDMSDDGREMGSIV